MADSQRIDDLRRRVQRDPTSIAFAQLAEECRRAGHYQEAVDVCRNGLTLHPGYLSARVTLGRALIELNELDIALAELTQVLKSAPENLAAIRGVAEIHHRQGSLTEALADYRAALALARNDPDLQRTVDELARKVEPLPPPASADGLSLEQMQDELLQNLLPMLPAKAAPARPPALATAAASEASAPASELSAEPSGPAAAAEPPSTAETTLPDAASAPQPIDPIAPVAASTPTEPVQVEEPAEDATEKAHALRVVAVLEQWADAIHVARSQRRP